VGLVGLLGVGFDAGIFSGSTDSGPAFLVAGVAVLIVMGVHAAVGFALLSALRALARRIGPDLALRSPEGDARAQARSARWLVAAVLPVGGGPLSAETKSAVMAALAGVECLEIGRNDRLPVVVNEPYYRSIVVHARVQVAPGADLGPIRSAVKAAVEEAFAPRADGQEWIVRSWTSLGITPPSPTVPGLVRVTYGGDDEKFLGNRLGQFVANSVPVVSAVEMEVVP
jgi:hypothetical protein